MEELIKVIVLGIIQGLTEFLPISSSGHLLLGRKLFGLSETGLFLDTMLHFGTFISLLIIFWQEIIQMIKKPYSRLSLLIIVGTIPTAIIGLYFEDFFEKISKTGVTVGWEFLVTGLILWFADAKKEEGIKALKKINYTDAFIIGTLQGVAILPAISRSGLTIAGSLFRGIKKEDAAKFSFLISLPAIFGGVILQLLKILNGEQLSTLSVIGVIPLIIGMLSAAIAGYVAVRWMLHILKTGSLKIFSYYVWFIGSIIIFIQLIGKW